MLGVVINAFALHAKDLWLDSGRRNEPQEVTS